MAGAGQKSVGRLHHNIDDVEGNPDSECTIVIRRGITMSTIMILIV